MDWLGVRSPGSSRSLNAEEPILAIRKDGASRLSSESRLGLMLVQASRAVVPMRRRAVGKFV